MPDDSRLAPASSPAAPATVATAAAPTTAGGVPAPDMTGIAAEIAADLGASPLVSELRVSSAMRGRGWITSHDVKFRDRDRDRAASTPLVAEFLAPGSGEDDDEPAYLYAALSVAVLRPAAETAVTVFTTPRDQIDDLTPPPLHAGNLSPEDLGEDDMAAGFPAHGLKMSGRRAAILGGSAPQHRGSQHGRGRSTPVDRTLDLLAASANELHLTAVENDGSFGGDDPEIGFYTGLVVVDGPLYEAAVKGSGSPELRAVEHLALKYRQGATRYTTDAGARDHFIDFVTVSGLERYLARYESWLETLFDRLIGNMISG